MNAHPLLRVRRRPQAWIAAGLFDAARCCSSITRTVRKKAASTALALMFAYAGDLYLS